MRFSLLELLRELAGSGEQHFVRMLTDQIRVTIQGARLVRDVVAGRELDTDFREQMQTVEREGDTYRAELASTLSSALVTPIDREDLFRLSRAIDDVLDHLRDFAVEWELYNMASTPMFLPLLDASIEGMDELQTAATYLIDDTSSVATGALAAKTTGNQIRRLYQTALAELLNAEEGALSNTHILKHRELLRRLDIVGLRIRQAADVLADASIKRSH